MEEKLMATEVSFEGKDKTKVPEGAEVIKKSVNISVKEIENGFIIKKNYDIKYVLGDNTDYLYFSKEVYAEENPIKIEEDKMLAEYFD
jgi:hypothetical protein